jgi:NAD(P)H-dependent flavin oxidoreductase YrpB (nitropropane dioxygenase family)
MLYGSAVDLFDRIGLEHPIVQAGMGGGVVRAELAGAVSAAGALGTIGILAPGLFRAELRRASELAPGRPVAANLLVPFTRREHVAACIDSRAALVVFHGGVGRRWIEPLRAARIPVLCTVGSIEQARAVLAAGADGLVAQGVEAGGHLMGSVALADLLPQVRELAGSAPVLGAGGVATAADVTRVLGLGATAAVAGTRFLLTDESRAHPEYKRRVAAASGTLRTTLFGFGWSLAHRVVPNAATERWCRPDGAVPAWLRLAERASDPLARMLPVRAGTALAARQRVFLPLYGPALPLAGMPDESVERTALYAGETVAALDTVVPAREAVARLVPPTARGRRGRTQS